MLDGAFFAKKTHPSRLLNQRTRRRRLGLVARTWTLTIRFIARSRHIVRRILDDVATDNLVLVRRIRDRARGRYLAEEERVCRANFASSADGSTSGTASRSPPSSRKGGSRGGALRAMRFRLPRGVPAQSIGEDARARLFEGRRRKRNVELRVDDARGPRVERAAETHDRRSQAFGRAPAVVVEAGWPAACTNQQWTQDERDRFMHQPGRRRTRRRSSRRSRQRLLPTAAVAEAAKAQAEVAKASGTNAAAAKAEALAAAMAPGRACAAGGATQRTDRRRILEIARNLGAASGSNSRARTVSSRSQKLAWGEPAPRHYLFTNRQGQKAHVDDRRRARRPVPRRSRAPGRSRAADRSRALQRRFRT